MPAPLPTFTSNLLGADPAVPSELRPGQLYALSLPDNSDAAALLHGAQQAALAAGRQAWLVERGDGADQLPHPLPAAAHALARVQRLQLAAGALSSARLLAELNHYGVASGALLVFDCAERLLAAGQLDQAALLRWRQFAETGRRSVVFVLRRLPGVASDALIRVSQAGVLLGGVARLRADDGAPLWEVFHWFGNAGVVAGHSQRLARGAGGSLTPAPASAPAPAMTAPAADIGRVLCMRALLRPPFAAPPEWETVADLEAMIDQCAGATATTAIFCFDLEHTFEAMARTIYTLRMCCGPRLKIVVRELRRQRYSQENLLMQLGANLLIPPEVDDARFVSMVAMVQGQVYTRVPPDSFETAIGDTLHGHLKGYLAPAAFVRAARRGLHSSSQLGVQSILLRLPLGSGLHAIDALIHCVAKRAGDLLSADLDAVYVFLFACREQDADLTLARLFRLPVHDLFEAEDRFFSRQSVLAQLQALEQGADALPDLSVQLEQGAPPAPADMPAPGLAQRHAGYPAPLPAIAFPLPLRAPARRGEP